MEFLMYLALLIGVAIAILVAVYFCDGVSRNLLLRGKAMARTAKQFVRSRETIGGRDLHRLLLLDNRARSYAVGFRDDDQTLHALVLHESGEVVTLKGRAAERAYQSAGRDAAPTSSAE